MLPRTAERTRTCVVRSVAELGVASRAAIADMCGLSLSIVSRAVNDLQRAGLLVEASAKPTGPGRPEHLVRLNTSFGYVLGVNLGSRRLSAVLTALDGTKLASATRVATVMQPRHLLETVRRLMDELSARAGIPRESILVAGVSVAGTVDQTHGTCRRSTVLGWTDVPIRALAEDVLGVPVYVDNDANAVTVGEHLFGRLRGASDAVMVTIGEGVGAGILARGRVYFGTSGAAGELGHIQVRRNGRECHCGKRGCLETVASIPALKRALEAHLGGPLNRRRVETALRSDHPAVRRLLEEVGRDLGRVLGATVNMLNPECVLVAGAGVDLSPLEPSTRAALQEASGDLLEQVQLRFERVSSEIWSLGAASLAVQHLFESLDWLSSIQRRNEHAK